MRRAYIEINTQAIRDNYRYYCQFYGRPIIGVIKADGYGHGAVLMARILAEEGCPLVAVATIEEALELRKEGIATPILVFGVVEESDYPIVRRHRLEISINSVEALADLPVDIKYHLKINTGMNRLGLFVEEIPANLTGNIQAIYTHYSNKDETESENLILDQVSGLFPEIPLHTGEARVIHQEVNWLRIGIGLYGLSHLHRLTPVMRLYAPWVQRRKVTAGVRVGYHPGELTPQEGYIYTLPLGYGDGWLPQVKPVLDNDDQVLGPICMDYMMVFSKNNYPDDYYFAIIDATVGVGKYSINKRSLAYNIPIFCKLRLRQYVK